MKNEHVLVLGKGFIGERIGEFLGCPLTGERIRSYKDIEKILKKYRPRILINAIGHGGARNIDDCEKAVNKTISSNVFVPILLAEASCREKIKLVHISSGCIYHYSYKKQEPITEALIPDFYELFYSRTKIYAENVLRELAKRQDILIVRVRVPLDDRPHPKNILTKLLSFDSVIDIPNSVTYIPDFLDAASHLLKKKATGIYNVALKGGVRYPALLNEYQRQKPGFEYKTMSLKDLRLIRTNLLLSTKKLEQTGFKVRTPKQIYKECVSNYLRKS